MLVHAITHKGRGLKAAERHGKDQSHTIERINEITGQPFSDAVQAIWTDAFDEAMVRIGERKTDAAVITVAVLRPMGLGRFAAAFPDRVSDVGIAGQRVVVSAAGLARAGMHPVVAVYATFLNRAFDQILMDVALHGEGVTLVLNRIGVTGTDSPSHNGMWDLSMLGLIPDIKISAPRNQTRFVAALERVVMVQDAPTVLRYSKERLPDEMSAITNRSEGRDQVDLLRVDTGANILIIGYGRFAGTGLEVAGKLAAAGLACTVTDPAQYIPLNTELIGLAREHETIVSIEDNLVIAGLGERLRARLAEGAPGARVLASGIEQEFLAQGTCDKVLGELSLTSRHIARRMLGEILQKR